MLKHRRTALPWLPATGSLLILPCILALLLDLHPGTTYTDHLPSAILLLVTGLGLTLTPLPPDTTKNTVPEEHKVMLAYAIRTGALPIASLFSDWRSEVARRGRTYSSTLRSCQPRQQQLPPWISTQHSSIPPEPSSFFCPQPQPSYPAWEPTCFQPFGSQTPASCRTSYAVRFACSKRPPAEPSRNRRSKRFLVRPCSLCTRRISKESYSLRTSGRFQTSR